MLRVLRDKFLRLGRDDDGVALVTTLGVFMFMYLVCMGVYAIGAAVKTRIHLQNACDAAAYSAAVVQADTLSRIATINRAMAWTYIQVSRRQMDWITYRWLEEVRKHWNADHDHAQQWAELGSMDCSCTLAAVPQGLGMHASHGHDWDCTSITLYGASKVSPYVSASTIESKDSQFRSSHEGAGPSFYASGTMTGQIEKDWETIEQMGEAIDSLKKEYDDSLDGVVNDIVQANLPIHLRLSSSSPKCFFEKMETYTEELDNSAKEEERFLSFVRETRNSAFGRSGSETGFADSWFVRNTTDQKGFRRGYKWGNSVLRAEWSWFSFQWHCKNVDGVDVHVGPVPTTCMHPSHYRCQCTGLAGSFDTKVYADNDQSRHDPYYETPSRYRARPNKLKKDYFKKEGTITVGLAVENDNPWAPIFKLVSDGWRKGIFAAFSIGKNLPWTPQYTVCFASAKAGYKETLNWENTRAVETDDRTYHVDWQNEEDWNLRQSDWDAVLIPVRMAQTLASGGSWGDGNLDFLDGYAGKLGVKASDMKAGGDGLDVSGHYGDRDLGEEYRFGNKAGFWGGAKLATGQNNSGNVNAKWQIGNPNQPIKWDDLQKVMFH